MLIKPINDILDKYKSLEDQSYLGMVEDNEDPEKLGRLKVRISPYMDFLTEELPWALPLLGSSGNSQFNGGLNIPEVGSQVRITFPNHDLTAPYYSGAELNEVNKTTFFDDHYPHTYGYKDSVGNFYRIDKAAKTAEFQHASTTNSKISPDGSVQVTLSNGAFFSFNNQNNFEININDAVDVTGEAVGSLSIKANSSMDITSPNFLCDSALASFTGDVSVGTGASGILWLVNGTAFVKDGIIVSIITG